MENEEKDNNYVFEIIFGVLGIASLLEFGIIMFIGPAGNEMLLIMMLGLMFSCIGIAKIDLEILMPFFGLYGAGMFILLWGFLEKLNDIFYEVSTNIMSIKILFPFFIVLLCSLLLLAYFKKKWGLIRMAKIIQVIITISMIIFAYI